MYTYFAPMKYVASTECKSSVPSYSHFMALMAEYGSRRGDQHQMKRHLIDFLTTKHKTWEHEEEIRLINIRNADDNAREPKQLALPVPSAIYVGWGLQLTTNDDIKELIQHCEFNQVPIYHLDRAIDYKKGVYTVKPHAINK